jgi:hypothetical protein
MIAKGLGDHIDISAWERSGHPVPPPNAYKRQVLRKYARDFRLKTLMETGTFHGEMGFAMKGLFVHIVTVELSPQFHAAALQRFKRYPHVECLLGDSAIILPELLTQIREPCLFWLDAHYSGSITAKGDVETPISVELDAVLDHAVRSHVVLIDDARCFDGTHDYPRLVDLKDSVLQRRPDMSFVTEHDIIRITPKTGASE